MNVKKSPIFSIKKHETNAEKEVQVFRDDVLKCEIRSTRLQNNTMFHATFHVDELPNYEACVFNNSESFLEALQERPLEHK